MKSIHRPLKHKLLDAFRTSPITLLTGPRQCGKTTLMKELSEELKWNYLTLDTLSQLSVAQEDPEGFISGLERPVIIDEVQRAPQIALPIKVVVDQNRAPGLFGLTGSANPLAAPALNDSLAGRMFVLHLWPLSHGEILQKESHFLECLFDPEISFSKAAAWPRQQMIETFLMGGYPPVLQLHAAARDQWIDNLLTTILERDVRDLAQIAKPRELAKVLSILATRSAQLLNLAEIGRISAIPYATLTHYMSLLEALFLIIRLPAWHKNRTKRLTKMAKLHFVDTALLLNQLRVGADPLLQQGRLLGSVLENFVFLELLKLSSWASRPIELSHFRTQSGAEVDFVLEDRNGQVVGIEVKASETISPSDAKGLHILAEESQGSFVRGLILYPGSEVVPLGRNCHAIPITSLWEKSSAL